jgi:galactofuranose transport system substrate-binding protein
VAAKLLGPKGGNVLEIEGRSGSPPSLERNQGFREAIEAKSGTKLLPPIVADWLRDKAEDEIASRIGGLPNVDVVFAQNDAMAYGAWKSFHAAGRKGTKFIGSDGLAGPMGGIALVEKGILAATFTCPTGGKEAVIYGMDLLLRKEGIPKKIYLRPRKVTRDELKISGAGELYTPRLVTGMDRPIVLGFAQIGSESEWRVANTKSIKNAAAKAGIELLFDDGKQQQANEIKAIRSFIKRKVDVIAFSPVVETGWDEVLNEARAAGIPVILTDRSVSVKDNSLWLSFMGSDFLEEGREAARWIVGAKRTTEPVNIVEVQGTIGSAPAIDRAAGFKEVLKAYPNYRIIASESGDFFKEQGYAVMKSILARTRERIDAVFAHNDDMAIGAIKAMEEAGLKPGKEIMVVSIDAAHGAFMAMIAGKLSCTIECNPLLGPQLMKAVQDYMSGKDLPIRMITSEGIFPAATAQRDMVGREY